MAKKMTKKTAKNTAVDTSTGDFLVYIMGICPFFLGLCRHWQMFAAAAVVLLGILLIRGMYGSLQIYRNRSLIAVLIIFLCAVLTIFLGISGGEAAYGCGMLLAAGVWILLMMQVPDRDRKRALSIVPSVGVVMAACCGLLYLVPEWKAFVFEGNRLAGFFQYSNTMALYLLIGLLIFLWEEYVEPEEKGREKKRWKTCSYPLILMAGILWTGSRTTTIMLIVVLIVLLIKCPKARRYYGILIVAGGAAIVIYAWISGNTSGFARILTLGQSSTFLGRLLYWQDAAGIIADHPLGLGYLGYYFVHTALQHGVYVLRYVHNEWIQFFLDYGIVAGAAFCYLFIRELKKSRGLCRWILVLMGFHMLMDFDLQYLIIVWMMLTCMDWQEGKKTEVSLRHPVTVCSVVVFFVIFLWMGLADLFQQSGNYQLADALYPWRVETKEQLMLDADEADEIEGYAQELLKLDPYSGAACDMLALLSMEREDYADMVTYKERALRLQPYRIEKYEDYVADLRIAIESCKPGTKEYQSYVNRLLEVPELLENVEEHTAALAYRIADKPDFSLSEDAVDYIESFR